jgi:hypothetical protein
LHADIPSIDFTPSSGGGEALFIGTDGGTYFSGDGGATVTNLSLQGLRISQYYSTLSDATDPQLVEGGSQDQGYQIGNAGTGQFNQIFSGDYSQLTSSDGTSQVVFSVYPAFVLAVENLGAGNFRINTRDFPAGEEHFWMAPLAADPRNRNVVYLGARRLYRYELTGINTWSVTQLPFNFQSQAGEYVSAIAIAPSDPNRWYVATNQGRLYFSSDAGTNWTPSTFTSVPAPQYLTGLALAVHPTSPEVVAVGGSGYGNPGVYLSQNGGVSFSALGAGQPQTLVTDLAWGPSPAGDLYAATESGPWRHLTTSGTWESLLQNTAPMTTYWSVERAGSRMRFGTYGRGAWDFETCIGIVAPTVAPSLTLGKEAASSRLDWTSSGSGMHYDVVRGSLNGLRSSFGNFTSATQACVADDLAAATVLDSSSPSPGAGSWYLVRAVNCAGTGTYDSGAATQQGSRDAEIAASTSTCP